MGGPCSQIRARVCSRDFLRLEATAFLTECSSRSPTAHSSLFHLAFVLIGGWLTPIGYPVPIGNFFSKQDFFYLTHIHDNCAGTMMCKSYIISPRMITEIFCADVHRLRFLLY